jgi:hypothetical protein
MYEFKWIPGGLASSELIDQMAELYSQHYGVWGPGGPRPGEKIKLVPRTSNLLETTNDYSVPTS